MNRSTLSGFAAFLLSIQLSEAMAPDWSKDAIWYQIFPERFHNGDPGNDPTIDTLEGTWPHDPIRSWSPSPWTSDWYHQQPWERANGRGFYYNAQLRRYGGDLQGILDKLDYLEELGVNALYLNPVFESPSLHKYGAAMYHHVDGNFGPDPEGDAEIWAKEEPAKPDTWQWTSADRLFLKLIAECHRRDMRIVIDGVFNHVGIPFWALQRARRDGPESEYASWFAITQWDDPEVEGIQFEYEGWAGIRDLPLFKHGPTGPNDAVKAHFRAVLQRWMDPDGDGDPSDGVDGWRLDVAAEVPSAFWREFRSWVKAINPEAFLTGEIWWEDYKTNSLQNAAPWLQGDTFDAVMNYRFADAIYQFFNQTKGALTATQFAAELGRIHSDYGFDATLSLQNLLDSHDTQRLASMVANPEHRLDHGANLKSNRRYRIGPPGAAAIERLRQIVVFQFLSPGAPYVYYGDEVGMWGADDPDCRKPMLWPEFEYEPERARPFGAPRKRGVKVAPDAERRALFAELCRLRSSHRVLRRGQYRVLATDDVNGLFAFERYDATASCVAVFNAGDKAVAVPDAVGGRRLILSSQGSSVRRVAPRGYAVFLE